MFKTAVKCIVLLLRVPAECLFIPACPYCYATFIITFDCLELNLLQFSFSGTQM